MIRNENTQSTALKTAAVTICDGVREAFNQDGAILLDIDHGRCLSLNVVGSRIWKMLKEQKSSDEVLDQLQIDFGEVSGEQLRADYLDFVQQLQRNGLVVVSPSTLRGRADETGRSSLPFDK